VVHLLFQLLEKDKFIKLLSSALDEPSSDALDRRHWIKVAEEDTDGFEDPIDYIQLIASLYERMNKLGGFDN
jgi:hypothetical protein